MDHRQLRDNIYNFSLGDCPRGNQGYNRVLLQLFGLTGHGKSSLVNSCKYVLQEDGEFTVYAEAKETPEGLTMIRKSFPLTGTITIVDNRGYNKMNNFQKAEVYAQLGNFLPLDKEVEWDQNFTTVMERVVDSEIEPNYTDFIVPVLVYSCSHNLPEQEKKDVTRFMENCVTMTGVAPIVVLTKKTSGDYTEMEKMFRILGAETVISVENYTTENQEKSLERSTDFLMFLNAAVKQVKYRMVETRNPRRERVERKKFVLQYAKDADEIERDIELEKAALEEQRKMGFWEWIKSFFSRK